MRRTPRLSPALTLMRVLLVVALGVLAIVAGCCEEQWMAIAFVLMMALQFL